MASDDEDNCSQRSLQETTEIALQEGIPVSAIDYCRGQRSGDCQRRRASKAITDRCVNTGGIFGAAAVPQELIRDLAGVVRASYRLSFKPGDLNAKKASAQRKNAMGQERLVAWLGMPWRLPGKERQNNFGNWGAGGACTE